MWMQIGGVDPGLLRGHGSDVWTLDAGRPVESSGPPRAALITTLHEDKCENRSLVPNSGLRPGVCSLCPTVIFHYVEHPEQGRQQQVIKRNVLDSERPGSILVLQEVLLECPLCLH
ncbi:hypothetical protein E5288_WYG006697 [Bos mutus]|uniref:Uncharacterized protein n=1 Tax=Bos mutus TaxID=72004 RepID=A0A6B0RKQ5_9CETA|nr:hypothetical protein [Bos mutus]